jgi:hypothetical protein
MDKNPQTLPGSNPTTLLYNATGSLARFENRNSFFFFGKAL